MTPSRLISFATAALAAGLTGYAAADDAPMRVAELEVKQRIESMEQVNVTAEIAVDPTAPAPTREVTALLDELLLLDAQEAEAESDNAE
ncbi:MAG: hypothetical protein AAF515_01320 [Pseudomonadota bacterium]